MSSASIASVWQVILCLVFLITTAPHAHAADHALLIGVSDYPQLPRRLWLRAPGNDVALMRETLLASGFAVERIRQLVSRAGGTNEPTRHNIVEALSTLRLQVEPGDSVVLYLAGHGSQQPQPAGRAQRPAEVDGLDEVFLPADVQRWEGGTSAAAIPNALLDDELAEWIDALVDRGAKVWAFFDTCHAAGMSRGRGTGVRAMSPAELGLPPPPDRLVRMRVAQPGPAPGRTDGRVFAMAARKHESTAEEWMPRDAPLGRNRLHGVFTYHLAEALKREHQPTLRDIERAVRVAYARERRAEPTPQFKGDATLRWR